LTRTCVADVYAAYNQYFKQFLPNNFGLTYQFGGTTH
jgi:ABC-type antimicrobial peptide transport system permease subunit